MNIAIVDLGLNNMSSLKRAIGKSVTDGAQLDLSEVGFSRNIDVVVLPGVGHFGAASRALDEKNLRKIILNLHQQNVPILGICLGLHLFFETSEESQIHKGLGLIAGEVKKLQPNYGSPVPNVGWCETQFNQEHIPGELNGDYYFTHSYYPVLRDRRSMLSTSLHGDNSITSGVVSDGIVGLQFHPEKSGEAGNRLLSYLLYGLANNRKPTSL